MKQVSKWREGSRQIRHHEKQSRTPAQRLLDSGQLQRHQEARLRKLLSENNPFKMKQMLQRLEDRFWSNRNALYEVESAKEELALTGASPLRCESPVRAEIETKNQAAIVS